MNNTSLYYSVGALLYCPANNETIVNSIINQRFGTMFSLALCLEDTIHDAFVAEAEEQLILSIRRIYEASQKRAFYMPKIFIRVRNPEQITRLYYAFGSCMSIVTGFIIPKFSIENADIYINTIISVNETSKKAVYVMPIYENSCIVDLRTRYDILYGLKEKLSKIEELVLNIRVGGNDLCHTFGFRRHDTESIHQIKPVSCIFSDIITVYGLDYVISGPVWEYYNGNSWDTGMNRELADDKLCGFIGKTVIHPKQIELVNNAYRVSTKDFEDARSILGWDTDSHSMVSGNPGHERMNEYKTHSNWALRTMLTANIYGTK